MDKNIQIHKNKYWDDSPKRVSITTPVFNRREELPRALNSVKKQTYNDFEYIIVNDGSTIDIDDIVFDFLNSVSFPILYLKKENGGVHTARNLAVTYARGEMICCCDSDDELIPNAIEKLIKAWDSISEKEKLLYREVCARCTDEKGVEDGHMFPNDINSLPWKKAYKVSNKISGEHFGFWRCDTLKENPWPEPEGITLVNEEVVWNKLSKTYRSYFINDAVLIIHRENNASYTRSKKVSLQTIKNGCWNMAHTINNWKTNAKPKISHFKAMILYITFKQILSRNKTDTKFIKLNRFMDKLASVLLWVFVLPISIYYQRKKLVRE